MSLVDWRMTSSQGLPTPQVKSENPRPKDEKLVVPAPIVNETSAKVLAGASPAGCRPEVGTALSVPASSGPGAQSPLWPGLKSKRLLMLAPPLHRRAWMPNTLAVPVRATCTATDWPSNTLTAVPGVV